MSRSKIKTASITDDAVTGAKIENSPTIATNLSVTGDLTVDTSTLKVDSSNNRVGVGLTAPEQSLHVRNSSGNSVAILGQYGTGTKATITAAANQVDLNAHNGTNDVITFATNSTERVRILSGGGVDISAGHLVLDNGYGIDFTATANSNATVTHEILDDYEIGTFTPTFIAGATVTSYTAQNGRYTKIGRQVMVEVDLDINVGSATNAHIYVGPMPFTSISSAPYGGGYFVYNGGFYNSVGQWLMLANSTSAAFYRQSDGAAMGGTSSGINIGGSCRFVLFYTAA